MTPGSGNIAREGLLGVTSFSRVPEASLLLAVVLAQAGSVSVLSHSTEHVEVGD